MSAAVVNTIAPPRIETPRLLLTWPTPAQVDAYYDQIVGTDVFDTLLWNGPESRDEFHQSWARFQVPPDDLTRNLCLAVIDRDSDRMVGSISWRPLNQNPLSVDLGYVIAKAWHGRGFATESMGALVDHGFMNRQGERVVACVFVGNHASRAVTEKLGFICEGVMRRAVCKRGVWKDEWLMAITRPDWEARRVP
jgi:ribosomal-protein-alanine N-acetyltransferase